MGARSKRLFDRHRDIRLEGEEVAAVTMIECAAIRKNVINVDGESWNRD